MTIRALTALPIYNEVDHVTRVLDEAVRYSDRVLVVDDGSTDGTSELLAQRDDILRIVHAENRGYGSTLQSAFHYAVDQRYDILVTIDCDGQHQPGLIPQFVEACREADIVSGSRYLKAFSGDSSPPQERRTVNRLITEQINQVLGLGLTDAFCGFKAYRVGALQQIQLAETGYAMPLEFWVKAAKLGLRIIELPIPLIYLDEERSFGGAMDDVTTRLAVYRQVLKRSLLDEGLLAVGQVGPEGGK